MAKFIKVFDSVVRTSSTSRVLENDELNRAAHFVVDHPNVGGGITVAVYGRDTISNYDYLLLSSAIIASGHTVMKIGPEYTAGANVAKDYIPAHVLVSVTASGTNAYSIGASFI